MGESFLADEALEKIRAEAMIDPLSEVALGADASASEIIAALDTPSLLGGTRLVVVEEVQDLNKEQRDALSLYLESPSDSSVLVLVSAGRTPLASVVKKAGEIVTLEAPKGRRLIGWLRTRSRAHDLKLDERAGWAMVDTVGTDLRALDSALDQLATALGANAVVGPQEVRRAFPRLADERIFAFTDAVGERKMAAAMGALRRLLEQDDPPLLVFGSLASHLRRLLVAREFSDRGPRAVGDALGLPEWRAERIHKQARSYRREELIEAMQVLAATDLEMKGGDMPAEIALERAVVKIVSA
jgi:DNA polymerase-3 subunit delta